MSFFVRVFVSTNIVSRGTYLSNGFLLDKFALVTHHFTKLYSPKTSLFGYIREIRSLSTRLDATVIYLTAIEADLAMHESSRYSRGSSYSAGFSRPFLVSFVPWHSYLGVWSSGSAPRLSERRTSRFGFLLAVQLPA